jgi:predicted DNA-binding transcriptional regulator YafY
VGFNTHPQVREHRLYVLANIEAVEVLDLSFGRDPAFDLRAFAARSFGAFWDGERFEVEWRFKPQAADDARHFQFHPEQVLIDEPDGSVIVRFAASGLTEMAWHLFTWGNSVEIIRPEALRQQYREWLEHGLRAVSAPKDWQ